LAKGGVADPAELGQPLDARVDERLRLARLAGDVELGAVAGRDQRGFGRALNALAERAQRRRELLGRERETAAQVQRRRGMVQPKGKDAHLAIIKFVV